MQSKRVPIIIALFSIALLGDKCPNDPGICGRSSDIQKILVDQAKAGDSNVKGCADVTSSHLAKITEIRGRIGELEK